MCLSWKKTLIFITLLFSAAAHADDATLKVCILNFEVPEAPISKLVTNMFHGVPQVTLHNLALPTDLLSCIRDRSTEILIIGHALETPSSKKTHGPVNLAYFRDLCGEERAQAISSVVNELTARINDVIAQISSDPLKDDPANPIEENRQQSLDSQRYQLEDERKEYQSYPETQPYYVIRPILPQIMNVARSLLASQAAQPGGMALKKIRLMSCLPDQVLEEYGDLKELAQEDSIALDVAPDNRLFSFIEGQTVTSPNKKWLRKSIPSGLNAGASSGTQ